jgi:hypothetical protein
MQKSKWAHAALGLVAVSTTACVGGQTGSSTPPGDTKSASGAGAGAPPPAGKLMAWDGETKANGKSWASCSKKDACQTTLEVDPKAGRNGAGLKFHAEGPDWIGFGWNWHGWWPDTAGDNISAYKNLSFWIKVEGKSAAEAPDPNSVQVWLSCSCKGKKDDERSSNQVKVAEHSKDFQDGQWHEVVIPLAQFYKDKGANFDKTLAWEFDLGTWSQEPRNFNIYVDEIGFDNR